MASLSTVVWRLFAIGLCAATPLTNLAQTDFSPQGGQYPIVGSMVGDQVGTRLALGADGGLVVWQDNATDEDGSGISARRVGRDFSGVLGAFRVNENGAGEQSNPQVALLKGGGAAFVWQSEQGNNSDIFLRILKPDGTFAGSEVRVNSHVEGIQDDPSLAVLRDGTLVVVWASYTQDGSLFGVYGQRFQADGGTIGSEFRVNQAVTYNQKNPVVASLENGGFVVAWLSDQPAGELSARDEGGLPTEPAAGATVHRVDVVAALFNAGGERQGADFRLNSKVAQCADPSILGLADGGFALAWSAWNEQPGIIVSGKSGFQSGWDVFFRSFDSQGGARFEETRVNSHARGDQFSPALGVRGAAPLVVWSSLGQEGFDQGVYGRFVSSTQGSMRSDEFRVNSTTVAPQLQPAVAGDDSGRAVVVWSAFFGGKNSYDLAGQRYSGGQQLLPPTAPYVSALSQSRLSVTWPEISGLSVLHYLLAIDGGEVLLVKGNVRELPGLTPTAERSVRLAYVVEDGRQSPWSAIAKGKTWAEDDNFDGLPDDWQRLHWGETSAKWPTARADSDGDGASNVDEFLAGTLPTDSSSVLRTQIVPGGTAPRLAWNAQPGQLYQVQVTADFKSWTNVGSPRFAAGAVDSMQLDGVADARYYRVLRMR